jgi:putative oxidoreductase
VPHILAAYGYNLRGVDLAGLLLRIALGVTMLAHGYNHIWGGGKIEGTARWFESLGLRPGWLHAWLASLTELGAGALLIVGMFNPVAAAGVVGVMVVAWITNHRGNGFFIFRPGEGWEYVANLTFAALALGALGPGRWSIDRYITVHPAGYKGLAITAVLGFGGAALLLAVFWRPNQPAPTTPSAAADAPTEDPPATA